MLSETKKLRLFINSKKCHDATTKELHIGLDVSKNVTTNTIRNALIEKDHISYSLIKKPHLTQVHIRKRYG